VKKQHHQLLYLKQLNGIQMKCGLVFQNGCGLAQKKLGSRHADIARACDFLESEQVLDIG
jgi:hypothetical protein